jgi:hypothetical protein
MRIALKEAKEVRSLVHESEELVRILAKIVHNTLRNADGR